MRLYPDFEELLRAFDGAGASFLVVGGYAVAFHGQPRATKDLRFVGLRRREEPGLRGARARRVRSARRDRAPRGRSGRRRDHLLRPTSRAGQHSGERRRARLHGCAGALGRDDMGRGARARHRARRPPHEQAGARRGWVPPELANHASLAGRACGSDTGPPHPRLRSEPCAGLLVGRASRGEGGRGARGCER